MAADRSTIVLPTRTRAVLEELRRLIVHGELPAGSRLRQNEFAERFGVSVTPVREAFAALAREGFVIQDDHRGVVVFSPSPEDLRENYEIRTPLECLATEKAAARITPEQVDDLEARLPALRHALEHDVGRYGTELSPQFHLHLYSFAESPRLLELITQLRQAGRAYLHLLASNPPGPSESLHLAQQDKEELCVALRANDADCAVLIMRRHLQRASDLVHTALPEQVRSGDLASTPLRESA